MPGPTARRWSATLAPALMIGLVLLGMGEPAAQSNTPQLGKAAPSVALPSDWAVGDRLLLDYVSTKEKYQAGARVSRVRIQVPIAIEVLEKRRDSYVLRWSFGASKTEAEPQDIIALVSRLSARIGDNTHLDLETDAYGTPIGIRNVEDLMAQMRGALDEMDTWLAEQSVPAATVDQIKGIMQQIVNPRTIEQISLKQPTVFLTLSGASLAVGETYSYDELLPNPLGGRPFPAKGQIVLRQVKPTWNWALIELTQTADPSALTDILLESLQAMAQRDSRQMPTASDLPNLVMSDKGLYEYDTASGWPRKVTFTRLMSMGATRRSEQYEFTVRLN